MLSCVRVVAQAPIAVRMIVGVLNANYAADPHVRPLIVDETLLMDLADCGSPEHLRS